MAWYWWIPIVYLGIGLLWGSWLWFRMWWERAEIVDGPPLCMLPFVFSIGWLFFVVDHFRPE